MKVLIFIKRALGYMMLATAIIGYFALFVWYMKSWIAGIVIAIVPFVVAGWLCLAIRLIDF